MLHTRNFPLIGLLEVWLLAALLSVAAAGSAEAAATRMALVVGNADYTSVQTLANPVNDATALADKLKALDFDVTLLTDEKDKDFEAKLSKFVADAKGADTVLFFFAGHAFQLNGANYLVPVNADFTTVDSLTSQTWDLDKIISELNGANRQTLVFLDACRNNPLPKDLQSQTQGRRGLARLQTGRGTFVAFATEPNNVTYDGDEKEGHSPFTKAILENIDTPGISISDMMIKVRNEVQKATFERQTPWDQSSLNAQFYFKEAAKKQESGFGAAELELLASLPPDQQAAFMALLKKNGIKTAFSEKDIAETIVIKKADEKPKGSSILIAGATPEPKVDQMVPQKPEQVATDRVQGKAPAAASADNVEVASADPALIAGESAPIVDLPRAEPSKVVGETKAVEVQPGLIVPAKDVLRGGIYRSITLASLETDARPETPVVDKASWLAGSEVDPSSPEGQSILQDVYGAGMKVVDGAVEVVDQKELQKEVQSELQRLGCYRLTVDGDWGRGSRTAAARYFAAKMIVPDSFDATPDLLRQLKSEENVVCKNTVARDQRVAQIVQQEAPARTFKAQTKQQKKETKQKLGLRPGVFR